MFCESNFQPMYLLASGFLQTSFNTLSIKLNTYLTWEHFCFRLACCQEYKLLLLKTQMYLPHNFQTQKMFTFMTVSTKQRKKKPIHCHLQNSTLLSPGHTQFSLICPSNNKWYQSFSNISQNKNSQNKASSIIHQRTSQY